LRRGRGEGHRRGGRHDTTTGARAPSRAVIDVPSV
jgi:hypothetical protein